MSTRATVHFKSKGCKKPEAIVYRHCDGYPEGLGSDLKVRKKLRTLVLMILPIWRHVGLCGM